MIDVPDVIAYYRVIGYDFFAKQGNSAMRRQVMPQMAVIAVVVMFQAACSSSARPFETGSPRSLQKRALTAVFEVVVKKPPEGAGASIVYEEPPDFSVLPYSVRTDEYVPVGTAFAVSPTEAVTAFHVLNLASKSAVYDTFCLRQRNGTDTEDEIYEIDTVTGASNEMDFVRFTVKDKTFPDYFQIEHEFNTGDAVYSVGNAWGEGVITRNGEILGTAPEEIAGRWRNIKTSAQGSPGNSGGPLVNRAGKAVGLVSFVKDTIVYSIPLAAIDGFPANQLHYALALDYGHLVLANRIRRTFEVTLPLPLSVAEAQQQITVRYRAEYENAMKQLFAEAPEYIYGSHNSFLLDVSPDSLFPQIDFVDKNDNEWKLADFEVTPHPVDEYQTLLTAEAGPFEIWRITDRGPLRSLPLQPDPRSVVDFALKKVRVERTLAGSRANETHPYRILSFGDPYEQTEYRDSLGRLWIEARFLLPFDDKVFIAYVLPTPGGHALLTAYCPSSAAAVFAYDMKKVLDHTHVAYSATFERWDEFLRVGKWVPAFLQDVFIRWESAGNTLTIQSPPLTARLSGSVFEWSSRSELFLSPAWQKESGSIRYGLQKLVFDKGVGAPDYAVLYRNYKPPGSLGSGAQRFWSTILEKSSPFDEVAVTVPNTETIAIGTVLQAAFPREDVRWTLYMENSRSSLQTENEAQIRLNALKAAISIK
jgi:hypothetical protein